MLEGTKALEKWCQNVTSEYPNVKILNMTTSWRNGLGFCAIIHHFRPELINYSDLDPDDVYGNNELAFNVGETHLGIPALLDPQDMVSLELLDRLSILTYLSQYFQAFGGAVNPQSVKMKNISIKSSPTKRNNNTGNNCGICCKPVMFILERLNVNGILVHRVCFKCKRCDTQLTLANYYETENGHFCCDMCPDEEHQQSRVVRENIQKIKDKEHEHPECDQVEDKEEDDDEEEVGVNSMTESAKDEIRPDVSITPSQEEVKHQDCQNNDLINKDANLTQENNLNENENNENEVINNANKEETKETKVEQVDEHDHKVEDEHQHHEHEHHEHEHENHGVEQENEHEVKNEHEHEQEEEIKEEYEEEIKQYPDDLNPFDDDVIESEEEKEEILQVVVEEKSISTNPFGSDFEEGDEEEAIETPIPAIRTSKLETPPPKPPRAIVNSLNPFGSDFEDDESPCPSIASSSSPVKSRKKRQAPLPPPRLRTAKSHKEKDNINRRSQIELTRNNIELTPLSPNKAAVEGGQWRRKKGPAPPRPIPPKRQVKKLPRKAVNTELADIEIKQAELERQGVKLEKTIRECCEKTDRERQEAGIQKSETDRDSLGPEAEDLIIQLFDLVNEKNELFRRQTELMYMKREHRLEEEHADLEHQIRVLMEKPIDEDLKKQEEVLINRLMDIVSQRNEIVDCLEMDRLRELEEDESIEIHMGEYAAIKTDETLSEKKKKKKKIKEKKKKKKDKSFDADKDIDTKEFPNLSSNSSSPKPSPKKVASITTKKLKKKIFSSFASTVSIKK